MAKQIILTQNNFGIPIELQFVSNTNSPVDLTDKTVEVAISFDGTVIDVLQATISSYTNGTAYIIVNTKHTNNVGLYTTFWSVRDEYGYITTQEDLYYYVKEEYNGAETPGIEQDKGTIEEKFNEINSSIGLLNEENSVISTRVSGIEIINSQLTNNIETINSQLDIKANKSDLDTKANKSDIETINSKLDTKITEISQDNTKINNKLKSIENSLNIKGQEKVSFYGNGLGKKVLNAVVGNAIGYVNDPYRRCYEVLIEENTDYFLSNCRSRNNSQAWAIVDKNDIVISCGKYEDIETGLLIKGMPNAYKLYFSMDSGSISVLYKYIDKFILYDGDKVNYDIVPSSNVAMKKSLNTIEGENSYIINFSNTKNTITIPVTASNFNTIGFWVNMKFFDVLKITKISIDYLQGSTSLFKSEITQDNLRFGEWFFHKVRVDKAMQ